MRAGCGTAREVFEVSGGEINDGDVYGCQYVVQNVGCYRPAGLGELNVLVFAVDV